jgi:hypothetical protein
MGNFSGGRGQGIPNSTREYTRVKSEMTLMRATVALPNLESAADRKPRVDSCNGTATARGTGDGRK